MDDQKLYEAWHPNLKQPLIIRKKVHPRPESDSKPRRFCMTMLLQQLEKGEIKLEDLEPNLQATVKAVQKFMEDQRNIHKNGGTPPGFE